MSDDLCENEKILNQEHDNAHHDEAESNLALATEELQHMEIDEETEGAFVMSEDSQEETKEKPNHESHASYDAFIKKLEIEKNPDAKLAIVVDFMETTLTQKGNPHFRLFWDARKICLDLFKENINPVNRANLWSKYNDLSKEARRLKEIFDEQSAFAAEQIEIAIQALENELENISALVTNTPPLAFGIYSKLLDRKKLFYSNTQKELNLLNAHASRINALRKELIKTDMRIRQKNKYFQRLSLAGDKVFPPRKDRIKEISQQFQADVEEFIKVNFSNEENLDSLAFLRDEIKALQALAKILTLNTQSFTQTRLQLSKCWDMIKRVEKERKKEWLKLKSVSKENAQAIQEKIKEVETEFQNGAHTISEAQAKFEEISSLIHSTELGRDDFRYLKDALSHARKPLFDKVKTEEQLRQQQEFEKERLKKEAVVILRTKIDTLIKNANNFDSEQLVEERDHLLNEITTTQMLKNERQDLEKRLKQSLKDILNNKKEESLLARSQAVLSHDDQQAFEELKAILKQQREMRQEIKNQLESYKKTSGSSSGLGFEQAMQYNLLIQTEKDRLQKIDQGIITIEAKISDLRKRDKK